MKINFRILNNFSPKKLSFLQIYRFTCNNCFHMDKNAPSWEQPKIKPDTYLTGLKVNNSLAPGKLVDFIPTNNRTINWYMCGPTVYDYTHMGHARTYLSFDCIRKILRDYFGYNVVLCMNITDIDDKIIIRSNEAKVEFGEFARKWETEFFKDMTVLGVEPPDVLTRVSEYVPNIVKFIEKIIENEFAYESNGSVYFDVNKYKKDPNHYYGKLEPFSVNDENKLNEGEGSLTEGSEKRSKQDFALWKKSKPNEPKWNSPWGEGRPGWHIECSSMAADIFDCPIDIHSGGVDLKFPHHDNELAQSEAFYNKYQWVNYFIHSGHLNIEGLKMSKSLKNFITIQVILEKSTPQQLRLLFLLHNYDALMNYNQNSFSEALDKDKRYREFFKNLKASLRSNPLNAYQKWSEKEKSLNELLQAKKLKVHESFCNNFNTPGVIKEIDELITAVNAYLNQGPAKFTLLTSIYDYIKFIFKALGLNYEKEQAENNNLNKEEILAPLINSVSTFRDNLRIAIKEKDFGKGLDICDIFRDEVLPNFGIRLEDKGPNEPAIWKYDDKDVILKEIADKKMEKEKKLLEKQKKEQELLEKMKIDPREMYKNNPEYTQFDEDGIPTHDKKGVEILKSLREKKLKKDWLKQKELHEKYLKEQNEKK